MDIWPELFVSGLPDKVLAMASLEPRELGSANALERSGDLGWLESSLATTLEDRGLPSEGLFVDVAERAALFGSLPGVLDKLEPVVRARSTYVSKMVAAAAVGLFDAALNYMWDELISELRRRVTGFDLPYFFAIAAGGNADLRKSLKGEDDLQKIDDANLLRAAHTIGLLSGVGYQRLDHIRFMRNHASAAHPNQTTLTGLDLANWLQICITEVINTPPDKVTASTGRLLANVKEAALSQKAISAAAAFFDQLPGDRADTLANGLFGLYTDPDRTVVTGDNVRVLWPRLWPFVGEDTRNSYGLRHARASASADTYFASSSRELLDLVDGAAYLTPEVRAVEISDALADLVAAHHGYNNFYAEVGPARRLADLAGNRGDVPASVRNAYVETVTSCFLGNGYGVSVGAAGHYRTMIKAFSPSDAALALRIFLDPTVSSVLRSSVGKDQWMELISVLDAKVTSRTDRQLLTSIKSFPGAPHRLGLDSSIRKLAGASPQP